jgi:hypothetical protein
MNYLILLLSLLGIMATANAQDLMLNGGFEVQDGVAPPGTTEYYSIEYAAFWHNLTGSCDLVPLISGVTRTGVGAGRLGVAPNGWTEFCYGTTQPLIAGHTYQVSFWIRKDYEPSLGTDLTYGLAISENLPVITTSPLTSSVQPLMKIKVESTQYVQAIACFTPQSNVAHYVTIGPFGGNGAPEAVLHLIDDVQVIDVTNQAVPSATISLPQPVYCIGDPVLLDGSASANETSYEWKIYVNATQEIYSSGPITGTAGVFNATNYLTFLQPGTCYRAQLTVYGVCTDISSVDFCFANPNIDFIYDGNPVCEGSTVDLQVTGDNGWTYAWSSNSGQLASGLGLKNLTVTPTIGNSVFIVVVTTPEGCTHTETLHLNVNAQNNLAPWMDGINGTGEYTYYVKQGDAVFFNSVLSNDYSNEQMLISGTWNGPSNIGITFPTTSGSIFSLSWVTLLVTPIGEYHYVLTANDQNACGAGIGVFDFKIIVVCDQCPICVSYEDRTPGSTPLPPETKAAKCIEAGLTNTVSTGEANVLFQAGAYITEGPFFDAGPGYEGIINPTTCVTDCEDCCSDWAGFTYDELPISFYLNLEDLDPTNDIIQVTDINHPFCAFGAKGFSFEVVDRWGSLMNDVGPTGMQFSYCCPFESPAPENPIPHSPIWWDGRTTNIFGNVVDADDGVYYYILTFYGCNGEEITLSGLIHIYGYSGINQNPNEQVTESLLNSSLSPEQHLQLEESISNRKRLEQEVALSPNPTTDQVQISGVNSETIYYQIFDEKGVLISHKEKAVNNTFSLSNYSSGTYYIRIYSGTVYVARKVIKLE